MANGIEHRDFFISFNSADLAYAEAIDAALRADGFSTFYHPRDLPPGGNVPAWMETALMNSAQTLALFSPDYVKDKAAYSFAERYASWWQDARGDERKLIPVVLRQIEFTPLLAVLSRIDVKNAAPKDAAQEVVKRLKDTEETRQRGLVQARSHLRKIFQVPFRPNPNFTGRFEALDALQKSLRAGNAAITAVFGMGGVGKTTLAAEYCHRFSGRYAGVWWIRAEQESVMLADLVTLSQKLGVGSGQNIEADSRACLDYLTTLTEPWLLVYDNAPDADAVTKWLPAGEVRCIITSRRGDFDQIAKVTPLDQWPDETTREYLLVRTGRDDASGAARLAKILDGLPLAAEQAAVFLHSRNGISFDDYAKEIARLIQLPKPKGATGDYPDTVYAAFVKSLEALGQTEAGNIGLDILRVCAFLSPDGVDLILLTVEGGNKYLPAALAAAMAEKFTREDALSALRSFSLLRQENGPAGTVLICHRLLLEVARDWMGKEARVVWSSAAVQLVNAVFPFDPNDNPSRWPLCARLMPHVAPLEVHTPRTGTAGKALDRLLNQACAYLYARGDRQGALALAERSVALRRLTRQDEMLELAAGLGTLGVCYMILDLLDDAEASYSEALQIKQSRLDPNDPSLASTLSNLAGVHLRRKQFAEAEALRLRAAEIIKAAFGAESTEYGEICSNLGAIYGEWADEPGQAALRAKEGEYKAKALTITRIKRGVRHHHMATRYNNLGVMKAKLDDWPGAAADMERAVAIMLSLNLAEHFNTQLYADDLLLIWEQSGQRERAERLRHGDISDLLPVIAEIEAEHRAWVAKDPNNRDFGPPSPTKIKLPKLSQEPDATKIAAALAAAGIDVEDLMRRVQSGELSMDGAAKFVAEQIGRNGG